MDHLSILATTIWLKPLTHVRIYRGKEKFMEKDGILRSDRLKILINYYESKVTQASSFGDLNTSAWKFFEQDLIEDFLDGTEFDDDVYGALFAMRNDASERLKSLQIKYKDQ